MNENGTVGSSPCCTAILLQSIDDDFTLAGVPVLKRRRGIPCFFRFSDNMSDGAIPFGPDANDDSPMKIFPARNVPVAIELCHPDAKIPQYAHISDSGVDVYALDDITIHPGETALVPTGIKVAHPAGYELQVRPKSGRALKTKLRVANTPGTIDQGYRDEIKVIIENVEPPIKDITVEDGKVTSILYGGDFTIGKGEKFCQLVLAEVPKIAFFRVDNVLEVDKENREGGFGSTGLT